MTTKPTTDTYPPPLTEAQTTKLKYLCAEYGVKFDPKHYQPQFDLPEDWVAGWIGGCGNNPLDSTTIYVGVAPDGSSHS